MLGSWLYDVRSFPNLNQSLLRLLETRYARCQSYSLPSPYWQMGLKVVEFMNTKYSDHWMYLLQYEDKAYLPGTILLSRVQIDPEVAMFLLDPARDHESIDFLLRNFYITLFGKFALLKGMSVSATRKHIYHHLAFLDEERESSMYLDWNTVGRPEEPFDTKYELVFEAFGNTQLVRGLNTLAQSLLLSLSGENSVLVDITTAYRQKELRARSDGLPDVEVKMALLPKVEVVSSDEDPELFTIHTEMVTVVRVQYNPRGEKRAVTSGTFRSRIAEYGQSALDSLFSGRNGSRITISWNHSSEDRRESLLAWKRGIHWDIKLMGNDTITGYLIPEMAKEIFTPLARTTGMVAKMTKMIEAFVS